MATYKIVGADEESNFPPRVMERLAELFADKDSVPDITELLSDVAALESAAALSYAQTRDTGWRLYGATLDNGWLNTNLRIRRIGHNVYLQGRIAGNAATADTIITLLSGFRFIQGSHTIPVVSATIILEAVTFAVRTTARVAQINLLMNWVTDDPWPTTLPGTAG